MRITLIFKVTNKLLAILIAYLVSTPAWCNPVDRAYNFSHDGRAYVSWINKGAISVRDPLTRKIIAKAILPSKGFPALTNTGEIFLHKINAQRLVLISRHLSKIQGGTGYCGAGSEVFIHSFFVSGAHIQYQGSALVNSCLESISLPEGDNGEPDFSKDIFLQGESIVVNLAFHQELAAGRYFVRWDKHRKAFLEPTSDSR